jgi:hypothetical protein
MGNVGKFHKDMEDFDLYKFKNPKDNISRKRKYSNWKKETT